MPTRAPRLCGCGRIIPPGSTCATCAASREQAYESRRPSARERGYDTAWDKARTGYLTAHPKCSTPGCTNPATVVDHIKPHRGDRALFWDRTNWQGLCASPCHSSRKQREERRQCSPQ